MSLTVNLNIPIGSLKDSSAIKFDGLIVFFEGVSTIKMSKPTIFLKEGVTIDQHVTKGVIEGLECA